MSTDHAVIVLAKGSHPAPPQACGNPERCYWEWYNWLTRQQHTDGRPSTVSTVLWHFGMSLNDVLPDDRRQELVRFLPHGADRVAGTADDGKDETRGYIALDWLIRTYTPVWMDLAGLSEEATALRDLRRIADLVAAQSAGPVVIAARSKAAAAWDAAWDAAGDAARDAARDKLAPTVAELQTSAIALYDVLITGEWPQDDATATTEG